MNLVLLFPADFVSESRVRLSGRRLEHIRSVHRAHQGDSLVVGLAGGMVGEGTIASVSETAVELDVELSREPPPPLSLALVLALPRPKVLNRVIAGATSMGVKRIDLINSWRVEKSYWKTPRLSETNLTAQCISGLEQAKDTVLPAIAIHRFFRRFAEVVLPPLAAASTAVVAHPGAKEPLPRQCEGPVTLIVGPEGGFIEEEIASLAAAGCRAVSLGPRVLRVETAVAAAIARLT